jgi:RNA polymerase sigma-70 factor (ECF subfamily)
MADFADLIATHLPRLRRYARALTKDSTQADDLVQETVTRALEHAHLYRHDANLRGWLVTIMHNLHITAIRRQASRPVHVSDDEIGELGRAPTQEAPLELAEIRRAVARLPEQQREALLAHWVGGLSYEEIAQQSSLPLGTIQSRIFRARQALRITLNKPNSGIGLANAARSRETKRPAAYTVLIVDDDPNVRQLAADELAAEGYRVSEASGGNEALRIVASAPIDLLFTDIRMPGMDGFELARRVKLDRPHLPVIYTTGFSNKLRERRDEVAGPLLCKPWHHDQLMAEIVRALSG